ncbi:putative pentatricopeptide repeat-containing protein At1g53330 [Andrographis paniculata]|uniref:putative pentatricopeptide repeat-containing protein At1g53330 n=1 Tax=Andrographis paniculata TaxID=175694 RepID=UPI0021E9A514|nr:putative pentatricopeptide repeat-containing protein At1g53330 [Andrographis paniculata]
MASSWLSAMSILSTSRRRRNKLKKISPFRLSSLLRLEKDPNKALRLFLTPISANPNPKPFRYSLLCYDLIISKLGKARMFPEMEKILHQLKNDARVIPPEVILCNVITYYGRARLPDKALKVFDDIPAFRCQKTIKSVNTLLNALLNCRAFDEMRRLVAAIDSHAPPDVCTYNILINACCIGNDLWRARKVFDEMPERGVQPNVVTFGTFIHGLCANSNVKEALRLKTRMAIEFGIAPNSHIYTALAKALCKVGELHKAIELKDEMLAKNAGSDPAVYSTLIAAFFKVGRNREAGELLDEMKRNGIKPDTVTYNAMINGFCRAKDIASAFRELIEMEKGECKPDVISYNLIMSALCREGKATKARELLKDMARRKCAPDIVSYRVVFDGLCDKKRFEDAASLLDEMILLGYVCPCSSTAKFIDRLVGPGEDRDVWAFLVRLVKRNSVDRCVWRLVSSLACNDDKNMDAGKLFNALIRHR